MTASSPRSKRRWLWLAMSVSLAMGAIAWRVRTDAADREAWVASVTAAGFELYYAPRFEGFAVTYLALAQKWLSGETLTVDASTDEQVQKLLDLPGTCPRNVTFNVHHSVSMLAQDTLADRYPNADVMVNGYETVPTTTLIEHQ